MTDTPADQLVTIYGGSGFLGRHTVRAFVRRGWRVRAAVRRPDLAFHLQPLGRVGQIHAVQANLRYPDSVMRAAEGSHAIVNLVGIMHQSGKQTFDAVQTEGARVVAQAAGEVGAKLVHVSALGADANSSSLYAQSKGAGEKAVLSELPQAVIMRPSILFGPEDDFFNRFASLARFLPMLPLIGGGETKFQPVFVGDVAAAIVAAVEGRTRPSTTYELGGPEVKTFHELMELVLREIGRERLLVPVPSALASFKAFFLEFLPKPPLTRDQVRLLQTDNVVSKAAEKEGRTLKWFGISPTLMEAVLPSYLWRFRKAGQFSRAV